MDKFKVTYYRTVSEKYEAVIEAETEEDAMDFVYQHKYGEVIKGEKLIESFSDEIEIDDIELINKNEVI